ncbi:MAG: diadenylate cyclase CdaA [Clostridia bacterium]|nr:diadenylate cyclase CdaA [Clostridia bacterium]
MEAFFSQILKYLRILRINDAIDIAIVAIILYYLIRFVRETKAMQLLKGLVIFGIVFIASSAMKLTALNYILNAALSFGVFAVIVIFQPELRNLLERVGRIKAGTILDLTSGSSDDDAMLAAISEVAEAAANMSSTRTGALMVFERETRLGEYISTGTLLDARISSRLLENIFVPNTPLHDGAVIMRRDKIITAGCLLPLTANSNLSHELGTRHRAAIGLSEVTDAVIIVVSEETGKISIALNGSLTRNLTEESLKKALTKILLKKQQSAETLEKMKFWRSK